MRNFLISLICLLIVLLLWTGFFMYSHKMSTLLQTQSDTLVYGAINKGDWESASADYATLLRTWHQYRITASLFLDAKDINEIDSTMDKAHLYMKAHDISNSSGEFSYLKDKFKFIHQNETPNLSNIF